MEQQKMKDSYQGCHQPSWFRQNVPPWTRTYHGRGMEPTVLKLCVLEVLTILEVI